MKVTCGLVGEASDSSARTHTTRTRTHTHTHAHTHTHTGFCSEAGIDNISAQSRKLLKLVRLIVVLKKNEAGLNGTDNTAVAKLLDCINHFKELEAYKAQITEVMWEARCQVSSIGWIARPSQCTFIS